MPDTASAEPRIQVRKPNFPFGEGIPRHWFGGSLFATHMANGLNLVFPAGERFFIRSVKRYADRIQDPVLREDIKGFMAQEVRHGMEHERFFEVLEEQGFDTKRFLKFYETVAFKIIEPLTPPALRLASTAAAEHFTASFAHEAFTTSMFDEFAHPIMRDLLLWHAAEEIEHKSVAFDVLQTVAPSYGLRIAGLLHATVMLTTFWTLGAISLLVQDPETTLARLASEKRMSQERREATAADMMRAAFRSYLRRDFHPNDEDDRGLARAYFAKLAKRVTKLAA